MKFQTGDVVRVTDRTRWDGFAGRQGVVYSGVMPDQSDFLGELHVYVIFTPDHAERARRYSQLDESARIAPRDRAYRAHEEAYLEVACLELVKRTRSGKRRGRRHRMRTGGVLGEVILRHRDEPHGASAVRGASSR